MKIDVHWHHVPRPFVDAVAKGTCPITGRLEGEGEDAEIVLDSGFRQELPAELVEVDAAIEHMDAVGLDVVAPSIAPPLMHYNADVEVATRVAQVVNDGLAEAAAAYPDRLRPLGTVPLQDASAAAAEVKRVVGDLGFAGVQISTHVNGRNLGDGDLRPFWQAAADHDAFVFLHPSPPPLGLKEGRLNRHGMANFVGLPIEHACALSSLMFDGVYEDVGPLKTCFAHGGGAFPYIVSRWEHGYEARLASNNPPMRNPRAYLGSVYADSLTHSPQSLRFLIDMLGEDHVMLGSDYPFDMGVSDPYGEMVKAIQEPGTQQQVAGDTAARLLGIDS